MCRAKDAQTTKFAQNDLGIDANTSVWRRQIEECELAGGESIAVRVGLQVGGRSRGRESMRRWSGESDLDSGGYGTPVRIG